LATERPKITKLARRHPVRGLLRFGVKLPVVLYRVHLGWLLGERFLLLTHVGRRSGKQYRTVIEVVDHDLVTDSYVVASGWGEKSDWFQNIEQTPAVLIDVGMRRLNVTAERLQVDQAAQWLLTYARKHPRMFRELASLITGENFTGTLEECRTLAEAVPLVAFRPRG
jgi:deazaflavin-dependent oxidoreductase (nitroreductase family)